MIAFNHPWALLLALPAAWLLWRSRRRVVETHAVANLFLWLDSTAAEHESPERRSLPPWLIWLQAAVLASLAIAIAAPTVKDARPDAALIIDVSTSMSARGGGSSRIELARAAAKTWLATHTSRSVSVIAAAAEPTIAGTIQPGSAGVTAMIDALTVVDGPSDIAAAIELARRTTTGDVAVISDLPAPAETDSWKIRWQKVGAPADNVAITVLTGTNDGGAILEVTNFGSATRDITIDVTGGPAPWRERAVMSASSVRSFVFPPAPARTLTAELTAADAGNAIASDDRRRVDVRSLRPRVLLASGEPALKAALGALSDIALEVVDGGSQGHQADVMVTSGAPAPAERASLVFNPGGAAPTITRSDASGVRQIDVSVDLANSSWPLTPAFPVFIADSIDWLSRRPATSLTPAQTAAIAESDTRRADPPHLSEPAATSPAAPRVLWFWFALLAIAAVAVEVVRRPKTLPVRAIAGAGIAVALIGIPMPFGTSNRTAVIALDTSASLSGHQRTAADRVRHETEAARGDDRLSVVRFGSAETDIASGLRSARAELPAAGDRRILLVSDGQETTGDAVREAQFSRAAGVTIDVVPVDSRVPAFVERVDAPTSARAGASVTVRISLKGAPNEVLRLTVARDGRELDSRRVVLNDAGSASIAITDRPTGSGITFYRAVLSDERAGLEISEGGAATAIVGQGRVLVISERRGMAALLVGSAPLDVVEVAPSAAPDTQEGLAVFSALIIDAIAPHRFTTRQLDAIAAAVSVDGAGLLFLGSKDSLDASEFPPGAFSEALPIDFTVLPNPPTASTSLALLVDISGSMASTSDGVTKISAARDAIARALAIIPRTDSVNVIGFAARPVVLIGPGDPRDAASVAEKLKLLSPSGSTALAPAVSNAVAWLKSGANQRRRLLVVTDGKTSMTDAEATRAAVRGQAIEVSVVAIGRDAEREWLTELAAATGGRAYFPDRLTDLAREVAREAARGTTGREINERFAVRAGAHPLAPRNTMPVLDGYIAGRLRDGATAAWKARTDDAVLAAWPRGLGRVAVFSSDLKGPWGAPLGAWRERAAFWPRAIEWIARSGDETAIEAELALSTNGPRFVVDLGGQSLRASTEPQQLPSVFATLVGPSGQAITSALHAVTATRFEGSASLAAAGDYRATITVVDPSNGAETRSSRGWHWTGDRESQSRGLNVSLLEEIARTSGGRVLPALGAPWAPSESVFGAPRTRQPVDAAPWLLCAALALLSFDYIRRASEVS